MKYFSATIMAGIIFIVVAIFGGTLQTRADVSQETSSDGLPRETSSVKQGVSRDGLFVVSLVPNAPVIPPRIKLANHSRTLRAFIAPNQGGILALYIESARPHQYFSLKGKFALMSDQPALAWTGTSTLSFYGSSSDGALMQYHADLDARTLTEESIAVAPDLLSEKSSAIIVP